MGYSVTITYEEIKWPVSKLVSCATCGRGRKLRRSATLSQTINPFNKIKTGERAGQVKTRTDILAELKAEAEAWVPPKAYHPPCKCPAYQDKD